MFSEIEKIIKLHSEIEGLLSELKEFETGENVDYSDIITDFHWNKEMLQMRLNFLKVKKQVNSKEETIGWSLVILVNMDLAKDSIILFVNFLIKS